MDDGKEEENNNEASASSWWGSWPTWLQSAKEKSTNALEFMKRDLSEFKQVVQTDAVAAVSSTAAMLKEKSVDTAEAFSDRARQSFTTVLGTITDVFAPQRQIEEGELMVVKNSELVPMDWWQTQLYMIRKDPKTYCHEPEGPPEMYESWLESFDISDYQDEMTTIMITYPSVQDFYDKLVPTSVSHLEFWRRYFYRVHLLRKAEAKRAELIQQAELISIDDIDWDKDEKLGDVHSQLYHKQHGLKCVEAEINIQNLEEKSSNLSSSASNNAQTDEKLSAVKTDLHKDSASVLDSPLKAEDKVLESSSNDTADLQNEMSSADLTDESRSSPVESIGKG